MTIRWNSLHSSCDNVPQTIRNILQAQGYTLYDPFDGVPGRAYSRSVRTFCAPAIDGWTQISGTVTPAGALAAVLGPQLSTDGTVLALTLDDDDAHITVFTHGQPAEDAISALTPWLAPGRTADALRAALDGQFPADVDPDETIPLAVLPDDVQAMAQKLNPRHINRLFNRILQTVSGRLGDQAAARDLLTGALVDWDSAGGRRIRAVMACLTISWDATAFTAIRDAYQQRKRLERNPNARLLPGDAEALQAVPSALDYTPIYGGKS